MAEKKWFVVHTYSGHENKVKTNLEKAIHSAGLDEKFGQILVATEEFVEMKDGKRKTSRRKTFPSYVMIEMDLTDDTRHLAGSQEAGLPHEPQHTGFRGTNPSRPQPRPDFAMAFPEKR